MKMLPRILRDYLALGVIINPLPFIIANGQVEDATPVMADFNYIVSQVNANAADSGSVAANTAAIATINATYGTTGNDVPPWTTTGVAPAIGNGTITGRWVRVGKHMLWSANLNFGTTTTFGTNAWRIGLPVNFAGPAGVIHLAPAQYQFATGTGFVNVFAVFTSGNPSFVNVQTAAGTQLSGATGAWGNGGSLIITTVYEVA